MCLIEIYSDSWLLVVKETILAAQWIQYYTIYIYQNDFILIIIDDSIYPLVCYLWNCYLVWEIRRPAPRLHLPWSGSQWKYYPFLEEFQRRIWKFNIGELWLHVSMENPPFLDDFPNRTSIYRWFSSQPRLRTPEGNLLYCFMGMSWGFDIWVYKTHISFGCVWTLGIPIQGISIQGP